MNWYGTVFEVIDMRSFSNLWYWIGLAVMWSSVSHRVLGVPWDLIQRARRHGEQTHRDVQDLVRVNVNRLIYVADVSGTWALAIGSAALTALLILAFWYWVEFAQALVLLVLPLTVVFVLSLRTARRIAIEGLEAETLYPRLQRLRLMVQGLGMLSIFVTAMFGMYQNLYTGGF